MTVNRFKSLDHLQQALIFIILAMILLFSILYPWTISKNGFSYHNTIFIPRHENNSTVYTAKLNRQLAEFIVDTYNTVIFRYSGRTYGPYTANEAPDAIPVGQNFGDSMEGVELWCTDELIFRGGVLVINNSYWLESISPVSLGSYIDSNGIERDENGLEIDPIEPDAASILQLINGPLLTHKGTWNAYFLAVFVSIGNVLSILFAEELFRWNLAFRIQNASTAEPSDWEIASRRLSWIALIVLAMILFIAGLQ